MNQLQEYTNAGQLLLQIPPGNPKILPQSFDEGVMKRLQDDLKKADQFLDQESKMWWAQFFQELHTEGIVVIDDKVTLYIEISRSTVGPIFFCYHFFFIFTGLETLARHSCHETHSCPSKGATGLLKLFQRTFSYIPLS